LRWWAKCWKIKFYQCLNGKERYIVTDIAGTTHDSIDYRFDRFGFEFNLVDTAGIRRKAERRFRILFCNAFGTCNRHSDICILMIDATRGFEGQDQSILAEKNRKGL
jgi:GTP-binding protein